MAIRVGTLGTRDLLLAAPVSKGRNWATAIAIDGVATQYGHWRGIFVRLPATFTGGNWALVHGSDANGFGQYTGGNDYTVRVGTDSHTDPLRRRRAFASHGSAGQISVQIADTDPQMALGVTHLILDGITNTSATPGSPVWVHWVAVCEVGTSNVYWASASVAANASQITGTGGTSARQVFERLFNAAPNGNRTPVAVIAEHFALAQGNFPWDTANNRPHFDAIVALAGGGAGPFHTYESLVAAQNAGTLGYANLRAGKSDLDYWWQLADLAALNNWTGAQSAGPNAFATDTAGAQTDIVDTSNIAPAHWAGAVVPAITDQANKFIGGRGARSVTVAGTHSGTAVDRRWVVEAGGAVVPGFDWAARPVTANAWSTTDTLPVGGPYRLEVRDSVNLTAIAQSGGWRVGTILLAHGQSGMELSWSGEGAGLSGSFVTGNNRISLPVAAGAGGVAVKLNFQRGVDGGGTVYAQPTVEFRDVLGGTTPNNVGQGYIACFNEWQAANPGHPLMIVNMAIDGTSMASWAANDPPDSDQPSWRFLGDVGAVAGAASGNNSGVVETYAAALGRYVDCHAIMWTPNMSGVAATRAAYVAAVDARFSNAASAPWLVFPPWRGHRSPPDASAVVSKRQEHIDFAAELGARGILASCWPDTVMAAGTSLHSAHGNPAGMPTFAPIPDTNFVGASRICAGIGRWLARLFNASVKAAGPRVLAAWFRDAGRTVIEVELGRAVRTLNGAAIANLFWISTDNGTNWGQTGFTVALSPDATRAVLTSTGAAWPATNVRVEYARDWPFGPTVNSDEALTERLLDGVLYDNQQHRGGTNFAVGSRAGNPMVGTNRTGTGSAGVPVAARGAAKLVATERFTGTRNVTVRLMSSDGITVLRERTLAIIAN
jgi:hypothetical protein